MSEQSIKTQIRIPVELHEQIRERAHRDRKSANQTMIELMEAGFRSLEQAA